MKYFQLFNIQPKFILQHEELEEIENQFINIQKSIFNNSSTLSQEFVNTAYETLTNEVKRLEYLLQCKNLDIYSFTIKPSLAEEIFTLREELEEAENLPNFTNKIKNIKKELDNIKFTINEKLKQESLLQDDISDLFSKFKCLNEIIKTYNK